jgi:hypothetical protein
VAPDKKNYVHQRSNSSICTFNIICTDDFCVLAEHSKKIKNSLSLAFYDLISAVYMCFILSWFIYMNEPLYISSSLKYVVGYDRNKKIFFRFAYLQFKDSHIQKVNYNSHWNSVRGYNFLHPDSNRFHSDIFQNMIISKFLFFR